MLNHMVILTEKSRINAFFIKTDRELVPKCGSRLFETEIRVCLSMLVYGYETKIKFRYIYAKDIKKNPNVVSETIQEYKELINKLENKCLSSVDNIVHSFDD